MTQPEHDEALVIEQRDRDAAADSLGIGIPGSPLEIRKTNIRLGNCDDGWLVKAFARHRTTDATRIAELEADLEWYADQFCEHGKYSEVCGRLSSDDCSGCRARATLRSAPDAE